MNYFITGPEGTIAKALKKEIVKRGGQVVNDDIPEQLKTHRSYEVRKAEEDITSRNTLEKLSPYFEKTDVIIHAAASVGTDFCDAKPEETILSNVNGTRNIVEVANRFHIPMIYFSTTAIFDPTDYGISKMITENTRKRPQTLYGITKYTGEMITEQECKFDRTIVRPVFGFSDFPDDLHSALTKMIYHFTNPCDIEILLNKSIHKTYTRVENIAAMTLNIVEKGKWNNDFNIGVRYTDSKDWFEYEELIKTIYRHKGIENINNTIKWLPEKDYLHWHQIETVKIEREGIYEIPVPLEVGVERTIMSVLQSSVKPYWDIS